MLYMVTSQSEMLYQKYASRKYFIYFIYSEQLNACVDKIILV